MIAPRLQGRISSDPGALNELNRIYPWLPNQYTIRSDAIVQAAKEKILSRIAAKWTCMRDFILYAVFKAPMITAEDGKHSVSTESTKSNDPWIFKPSLFPFGPSVISNHWILWNRDATFETAFADEEINRLLHTYISRRVGHMRFQFAWYKNPSHRSQDFWHIHVFWTED